MKNIVKVIVGIVLTGSLFSCEKDIEIMKVTDTSWDVDQKIKDKDLRNRFGLDPRFNYLLTEVQEYDFPMYHLGELPISGENIQEIEIKLIEPIEKDLSVSLKYNEELFNKAKDKFTDFKLGAENLLKIAEKQKVIPAGATSVKFQITIPNDPNFAQDVVVPFSLEMTDDKIKLLEDREHFFVKIYKKEIEFAYPSQITKNLVIKNFELYPFDLSVEVEVKDVILDPIELSIQRVPNSSALNPAPEGIEGTLPDPMDILDAGGYAYFPIDLQVDKIEDGKVYQLPLQLTASLGGKSYVLPRSVVVLLDAASFQEDKNAYKSKKEIGLPIRRGLSQTGVEDYYFLDYFLVTPFDNTTGFPLTIEEEKIVITLNEKTTISSLKIGSPEKIEEDKQHISNVDVYTENKNGQEIFLGSVQVNEGDKETIIAFNQPIYANKLILKNFGKQESGKDFVITTLAVYQR